MRGGLPVHSCRFSTPAATANAFRYHSLTRILIPWLGVYPSFCGPGDGKIHSPLATNSCTLTPRYQKGVLGRSLYKVWPS